MRLMGSQHRGPMPQRHLKDLARDAETGFVGKPDNLATIALLERWSTVDATVDAFAIARAEQELPGFKASLNASRPAGRPVFA